jgi:hypothetical protein
MEVVLEVLGCGMLPGGPVVCVAAAVLLSSLHLGISCSFIQPFVRPVVYGCCGVVLKAVIPQSVPRHGRCRVCSVKKAAGCWPRPLS